jgi:glycosyltransferase involved in cell wall biosynthesis
MLHVLLISPYLIPSVAINQEAPLRLLASRGLITLTERLETTTTPTDIEACSAIVTGRNMEPRIEPLWAYVRALGKPIISELDDDLFAIPADHADAGYYADPGRQDHLAGLLAASALVRVYSPALLPVVRERTQTSTHPLWRGEPPIFVVKPGIDRALLPDALPTLVQPLTLVYATSRIQGDTLFPLIADDVRAALDQYPDRLRMVCLGYHPPKLRGHPSVTFTPFQAGYARFMHDFTRAGYGIGLAPMLDDHFHLCKTNLKFRDYAAAGAAGIYTDCALYAGEGGVRDGETGLLVANQRGAWAAAIARLAEDDTLRERIRTQAYAAVLADYDLERVADVWLTHLCQAVETPPRPLGIAARPAAGKWPFTSRPIGETPLLARLRTRYRTLIPMRVRLALREIRWRIRERPGRQIRRQRRRR